MEIEFKHQSTRARKARGGGDGGGSEGEIERGEKANAPGFFFVSAISLCSLCSGKLLLCIAEPTRSLLPFPI